MESSSNQSRNPTLVGSALLGDTPVAALRLLVDGHVHQRRIQLARQQQQLLRQPRRKHLWARQRRGNLGGDLDDLAGVGAAVVASMT
jgi:hypothetical protein